MRWLLLPLLLLALLAPAQECPARPMISAVADVGAVAEGQGNPPELLLPPLRLGNPAAWLGTDQAGRDALCLNGRGLRRSLLLALGALGVGLLPGVALGLWQGWQAGQGRPAIRGALPWNELLVLLAVVLLLGPDSFRLVLVLGVVLLTARLVAVRTGSILREAFVEGAVALGGRRRHVLLRHVLPHLQPSLPAILATVLSAVFIWLMELGALGFHDQPTLKVAFTDNYDLVQDIQALPLNADLGQLISFFRWRWLDTPEQLALPALLLVLLTLSLKDLARWAARPGPDGKKPQ